MRTYLLDEIEPQKSHVITTILTKSILLHPFLQLAYL